MLKCDMQNTQRPRTTSAEPGMPSSSASNNTTGNTAAESTIAYSTSGNRSPSMRRNPLESMSSRLTLERAPASRKIIYKVSVHLCCTTFPRTCQDCIWSDIRCVCSECLMPTYSTVVSRVSLAFVIPRVIA